MASEHGADFRRVSVMMLQFGVVLFIFGLNIVLVGYCCCEGWPLESLGFEGMIALRQMLGHELY